MEATHCQLAPPFCVLYQSVELDVDMAAESIEGVTSLWLLFRDAPPIGSVIALHNRTLVRQVQVNGIEVEFDSRDPMETLYYDGTRRQNFLGKEADINYRAALELTREGELHFEVPDLSLCPNASVDPANIFEYLEPVPGGSKSEVKQRLAKIEHALERVKIEIRGEEQSKREKRAALAKKMMDVQADPPGEISDSVAEKSTEDAGEKEVVEEKENENVENEEEEEIEEGVRSRLLQVKIRYVVPKSQDSSRSRGVVFRQSAAARLANTSSEGGVGGAWRAPKDSLSEEERCRKSKAAEKIPSDGAACLYTTGAGGEGALRDLDGVRCWLPCLDSPEQRPIFDITVRTSSSFQVICCGRKVSSILLLPENSLAPSSLTLKRVESYLGASAHSYSQSHSARNRCATRFVTPVRIPAFSLGFFVGTVEVYNVPLYKVHGRAWVAMGLGDMVLGQKSKQQQEQQVSSDQEDEDGMSDGLDTPIGTLRVGRSESGDSHDGARDRKRARLQEVVGSSAGAASSASFHGQSESPSLSPSRGRARSMSFGAANGHREHASSIDETQTARLRSMHLPQLYEAAVRHSALGLDMSLRLLHKFVGHAYDHQAYTQVYVDGLGDTFLAFDGFSLIDSHLLHSEEQGYAETSAHMLHLRAYLYSWLMTAMPIESFDAAFVLHGAVGYLLNVFVEQVYGEEDGVYRLQKHIDTCIELEKLGWGLPLTSSHPENPETLSPPYLLYLTSKSTVLYHMLEMQLGGRDSMRLALKALVQSPSLYDEAPSASELMRTTSMEISDSLGAQSPASRLGSMLSADPAPTLYPLLMLGGGDLQRTTSKTVLRRQQSITVETGWAWLEDPFVLHANAISVESFFVDLRNCASSGGGNIELPDDFVPSLIHSSGAHLLHVSCAVEHKVENKPRYFNVTVNSISCTKGQVAKCLLRPMDIKFNVVEAISETSSDFVVATRDENDQGETHQHALQTKAVRQRLRKRKGVAKPSPAQEMELLEKLNRERLRHRRLREHLMDSLELAREMDHPIKLLCPDPRTAALYEAHLQIPDPLLVELLFSETDALDSLRHVLALRSLARMNPLANVSNSLELSSPQMLYDGNSPWTEKKGPPHSSRLQLRALSDCLNGACPSAQKDPRCVPGPHHSNIRCEAAFALMTWQNLRSPRSTISDNNVAGDIAGDEAIDPWAAQAILLAALRDSSMENGRATPLDLSSETACRMRFSLLLAVSGVRSLGGYTPQVVIDAILHFASTCDEVQVEPVSRTGPFGGASKRERLSRVQSKNTVLDNSQYKAVLLLALSNVRPEPTNGGLHFASMTRIREFAQQCLQNDWTAARTSARIAARPDEPSRVPVLAMGGTVTALGLHCLCELDIHFCFIDSLRGTHEPKSAAGRGLGLGFGPFTGVNYAAYCFPANSRIGGRLRVGMCESGGLSDRFFATSPAVVRAAGLEATVRLLLAQHDLEWEWAYQKADQAARKAELTKVEESLFVSTAVAAVMAVLNNESNRWTRRQAALTLHGNVLDRPARIGLLALGRGELGSCLVWSDAEALALKPTKVSVAASLASLANPH